MMKNKCTVILEKDYEGEWERLVAFVNGLPTLLHDGYNLDADATLRALASLGVIDYELDEILE